MHVAMELVIAPLLAMNAQIAERPSVPGLSQWFDKDMAKLFVAVPKRVGLYSLQIAPQGVVEFAFPRDSNKKAIGLDVLKGGAGAARARACPGVQPGFVGGV